MAMRPPSNGGDEPESIEFGIAALDARLDQMDVSFPVTRDELDRSHGDMAIPVDPKGRKVPFSEILEDCEVESFDSEQELLDVLHPIFEEKRATAAGGILGRIRSLIPF